MFNLCYNVKLIFVITIIILGLITIGDAGVCWLKRMGNNNKCKNPYSSNMTWEECCRGASTGAGYTDKELNDVELFFAIAIDDGGVCRSCLETCEDANCGPNKRCVIRKGRPKCICSPMCKSSKEIKNKKFNLELDNNNNNNNKNKPKRFKLNNHINHNNNSNNNKKNQRKQKLNNDNNNNNNNSNDIQAGVINLLNSSNQLKSDKIIINNSSNSNNVRHKNKKLNRNKFNNNNKNNNNNNNNHKTNNHQHNHNNNNDSNLFLINSELNNVNNTNNLILNNKNSDKLIQLQNNHKNKNRKRKHNNIIITKNDHNNNNNYDNHDGHNHNNNNGNVTHKNRMEDKIRTSFHDTEMFMEDNFNQLFTDKSKQGPYFNPVCGTDGRTYKTECQLKKRACRQNNNMLTVAYRGHCQTSCRFVKCSNDKHCLEDQNSVPHCVQCVRKCPSENNISPSKQACGVDGITYPSLCHLKLTGCNTGRAVAVAYRGPCIDAANCNNVKCKDRQVCLTDLITQKPRCVSCSFKCPRKRRPQGIRSEDGQICGTNNSTYHSWCHMMKDSCHTKYYIDAKYSGYCRKDKTESTASLFHSKASTDFKLN